MSFYNAFTSFLTWFFFIQFRDKIDRHLTEKALGTNNRTKHVRQVNSRILFYKVDIHVFFSFFGRLVKRKQRSKVLFYDGYVEQILYRVCGTLNWDRRMIFIMGRCFNELFLVTRPPNDLVWPQNDLKWPTGTKSPFWACNMSLNIFGGDAESSDL